jgi:hypothetical protein
MSDPAMIESISAVTLATHDMARAVRFYRMLGFGAFKSFRAGWVNASRVLQYCNWPSMFLIPWIVSPVSIMALLIFRQVAIKRTLPPCTSIRMFSQVLWNELLPEPWKSWPFSLLIPLSIILVDTSD